MAYVTGNFSSMAALESAVKTVCVDNGWTLSNGILSKNGCFVDFKAASFVTSTNPQAPAMSHLSVQAGNGASGAALTDAAPLTSWIGPLRVSLSGAFESWTWPAIYHVHVLDDPNEVWVFVNYNGTFWQWFAFGQSPAPGCTGTGNWQDATFTRNSSSTYLTINNVRAGSGGVNATGPNNTNSTSICPQPFWILNPGTDYRFQLAKGSFHGVIDEDTGAPRWSNVNAPSDREAFVIHAAGAAKSAVGLYGYTTSLWNNEALLIPIDILQDRASAKVSVIGAIRHARLTRNTYLADGEVISLGTDRWKVYPVYRRNPDWGDGDVDSHYGGYGKDHSGTFAIAVRYDGA